jgi:two-component system chemotaxis sensor kinase CheA
VDNAASGEEGEDVSPLIRELKKIAKGDAGPDKPAAVSIGQSAPAAAVFKQEVAAIELSEIDKDVIFAAEQQGLSGLHINVTLDEKCVLKSARVYMVMTALGAFGEVIKAVPPVEELEKENFLFSFDILLLSAAFPADVERKLLNISEISKVSVNVVSESSAKDEPAAGLSLADAAHPAADVSAVKPGAPAAPKKIDEHKVKNVQSVRVDIDKLDTLLNIVGEIVINKTRLAQIGIMHRLPDLVETIEQMDRVTTELQAIVMKIRMVPIGQVFNRFPRMVRDVSRELNKEINLIIEGEETELDRTVIDEIGDPLMHILRNSLDHGIESAEARRAAGKKPTGEVKLIASHEGNNVVIDIEDDGKGIDPDFIKRKAVEKGAITQQEADKMDDNEAVKIIFLAGFSTATAVTDISGRGVGMDVVRTKI